MKLAGVPVISRAMIKWCFTFAKARCTAFKRFSTVESLIEQHFRVWSNPLHEAREGLTYGLNRIHFPAVIVETGTSAWGCDSSRLFDGIVRQFGGQFYSVDLRSEASEWLKFQTSSKSKFYVMDSLAFLADVLPNLKVSNIDFAYLDSFDFDFENPHLSEMHHLKEFELLLPYLRNGSIIVVDDQPGSIEGIPIKYRKLAESRLMNNRALPGKGSRILEKIQNNSHFRLTQFRNSIVIQYVYEN